MLGARPNRRGGFTLIEILGAVTILAIVYSWLATSAMQGMRSEGLSKRRLEASLRVDEAMATLETELAAGAAPPVGTTERALDDVFDLVVDVTPFDPSPYLVSEDEEPDRRLPPVEAVSTLLAPPESADTAFLRIVDMRVVWDEAGEDFEVRRTTLVYDPVQVAELFPDADAEAGDEEPAEEEDPMEGFLKPDGTPDLQKMLESLQGGDAP